MKREFTDQYFKEKLSPEQYHILREKGTERAFTGKFDKHFDDGIYSCAACGVMLFSSDAKFASTCGWPSFDKPEDQKNIILQPDNDESVKREEVLCRNCGSHLGHVFDDGPKETTGQRYCINSLALDFKKKD